MTSPALRAVADAARAAAPVSLPEVQADAELLARFDRGYLLPAEVFTEFAARLTASGFRALTIGGRRSFRYHSVYLDTPGLRCFHDHRQGRRLRFKVRERVYEDSGERQFEVKLKGRRGETVKHRRELGAGESAEGPAARAFLADVLRDAYGIEAPDGLRPSAVTDYRRATFVAAGQRVTCDTGLVCRDPRSGAALAVDRRLVVVETKSAGHLTETDRLLHRLGVRAAEFTKYCGALAVLRPDLPANQWRRAVRTAFGGGPGLPRSA